MEQRRKTPSNGKSGANRVSKTSRGASRKRRRRLNPHFLMLLTIAAAVVLFCCVVVAIIISASSAEESGRESPDAGKAQLWFDTESEKTDKEHQLQLPQIPGKVFKRNANQIMVAKNDGENEVLVEGVQLRNGYYYDLSGDGVPEICATVTMGTGIVDSRVWVYDPVAARDYMLEDRLRFDYSLSLEDGVLTVTQRKFASRNVAARGPIVLKGERLSFTAAEE